MAAQQDGPRYFVVGPEGDKGPFSAAQIRDSLGAFRLSPDAELRADTTGETLRARDVPPVAAVEENVPRRRRRVSPRRDEAEHDPNDFGPVPLRRSEQPGGSFVLGFLVGAFLGILVIFLVARMGRASTRRGVLWGAGLQLLMFLAAGAAR